MREKEGVSKVGFRVSIEGKVFGFLVFGVIGYSRFRACEFLVVKGSFVGEGGGFGNNWS